MKLNESGRQILPMRMIFLHWAKPPLLNSSLLHAVQRESFRSGGGERVMEDRVTNEKVRAEI